MSDRWPTANSARLAKFQHVDIDWLRRGVRGGVSCIRDNVKEITLVDKFESRRLDLRPDQRFVRAVQGLDDARACALLGRVITHDQFTPRLQRLIESLDHLGAIDAEVSDVVIGIEKRHKIEVIDPRWRLI